MAQYSFLRYRKRVMAIISILHVLSAVVGMGAALASDYLFSFYAGDKKLDTKEKETLTVLGNLVIGGLIALIITGLILFFSNTEYYANSSKFLIKMTMVGVLTINGLMLHWVIQPHFGDRGLFTFKKKKSVRQIAFVGGAISLTSWVGALSMGVLSSIPMTYTAALGIYLVILGLGIAAALIAEHVEFGERGVQKQEKG